MTRANTRFLALLRGINVGGRNIISKGDLRKCFEDLGFGSVRTYIQSGNVLFRAEQVKGKELTELVERGLSERFSYDAQAIVFSYRKYKSALQAAPDAWGYDDSQKHNALFTLNGITPKQVLAQLSPPKTDIETRTTGPGVIFWSVSKQQLTRSTYMKLAKEPVYRQVTIRNHNTTFKLSKLFEEL